MINLDDQGTAARVWAVVAEGCGTSPDPGEFAAYCAARTGPGCPDFSFMGANGMAWTLLFYGGRNLISSIVLQPTHRRDWHAGARAIREAVQPGLEVVVEGRARAGRRL